MSETHMKVECGSLKWRGKATDADEAIIAALSKRLPEQPAELLRVWDGLRWQYIAFRAALKIAGYTVKQTKSGFGVNRHAEVKK